MISKMDVMQVRDVPHHGVTPMYLNDTWGKNQRLNITRGMSACVDHVGLRFTFVRQGGKTAASQTGGHDGHHHNGDDPYFE
jgi:hypothetical protein